MENELAVLVVDDEHKILEIVQSYLERSGYRAFTAGTGASAFEIMRRHHISLLILDLMLPDMPGEDICKKIRETSSVPIIMMTAKSDEESIIGGLDIGADDYVTKPFSPRQLMARVAAVLRRGDSGAAAAHGLLVDLDSRSVQKDGKVVTLTPNEYRILTLLMSRPQKTFSRDEIILGVKDDEYDGFDRTIDTHIKNLRYKIEDDPKSPRYIVTVYGIGYKYGGDVS